MKRVNAIVIAFAAVWLLGAVASFWRASDVAYVIAGLLAAGLFVLLAAQIVRRVRR